MIDRCEIKGCRREIALIYLERGVCSEHWNEFTAEDLPDDALRMALGISAQSESVKEEEAMSKSKKKVESVVAPAREAPAEAEATKAPPSKKAAKKREPKEKIELRTLALRVTNEEFDLVHEAAGPRGLSAFMKTAVLGAASKALSK